MQSKSRPSSHHSLAAELPPGRRRGKDAERRLAEAYRALFDAKATKPQAEMVLTDLARVSGFFNTLGAPFSHDERAHFDGQRAVYGHIYRFLRMTEGEMRALQEAARVEALVDANEGSI